MALLLVVEAAMVTVLYLYGYGTCYSCWWLTAMDTVLYLYVYALWSVCVAYHLVCCCQQWSQSFTSTFVLGLGLGYQLVGDGCSWDVPKIEEVVKERVQEEKK